TATNIVFGKGNPEAKIFFIGEAPGANEDLQGLPFVGAAGKELDRLLHLAGLSLEDVYVANILKYRPPGNRNPLPDEIRAHTPFLVEQIQIIAPKVVVTLGNFSTKFVLAGFDVDKMNDVEGITKLRGAPKLMQVNGFSFTVLPLFHPAAVLYRRQWQKVLEEDFLKLKDLL
ncbi:MAG: uracil-DNA glycosylase, partial [Candidatus Diapherotrites archaeon]|nr:uracil-DNA glycosylase [Candidatus Diapherotrites archaeon]